MPRIENVMDENVHDTQRFSFVSAMHERGEMTQCDRARETCVNGLNDVYTYLCGMGMNYANACRVHSHPHCRRHTCAFGQSDGLWSQRAALFFFFTALCSFGVCVYFEKMQQGVNGVDVDRGTRYILCRVQILFPS